MLVKMYKIFFILCTKYSIFYMAISFTFLFLSILSSFFVRSYFLVGFTFTIFLKLPLINKNCSWCQCLAAVLYLFKVHNRNTRRKYEICSKQLQLCPLVFFLYTLKTSESQRFSDVFRGYRKRPVDAVLVSLLLTLNRFHSLFSYFHCWLWTS